MQFSHDSCHSMRCLLHTGPALAQKVRNSNLKLHLSEIMFNTILPRCLVSARWALRVHPPLGKFVSHWFCKHLGTFVGSLSPVEICRLFQDGNQLLFRRTLGRVCSGHVSVGRCNSI